MDPGVVVVGGADAAAYRDRIRAVYAATWGAIADPDAWDRELFDRHRGRPDYRLAVALDGDDVVGFAWGHTGLAGQPYADAMIVALGEDATDWAPGHFEFVELAVAEAGRGRGLGRRLHDALLDGLPHDRVLLLTKDADTPAVGLYRSAGWERLAEFRPGTQLMGLRRVVNRPASVPATTDAEGMSDTDDDRLSTDGMPERDQHLHDDPLTQGMSPLEAELGTDGDGDLAPEDDPMLDEHADDGPTDLRDHL